MKTKPQQFANTKVDVEKLATTITDRSGYEGDEANAYQSGIITGYELALRDNEKAVNMHDELLSEMKNLVYNALEFDRLPLALQRRFESLLKQAEQK